MTDRKVAVIGAAKHGGAPDDADRDMHKVTQIMAAVICLILVVALAVALYAALS